MKTSLFYINIALLCLTVCCNEAPKETKTADQICGCIEPYAQQSKKLIDNMNQVANVSEEQMIAMTTKLQTLTDSINNCANKFKQELEDPKVISELKKSCPESANQLGQ